MPMLQYTRQQSILEYLQSQHTATIGELAKAIYTSEASVRRDIAAMEAEGLVLRVYGGVVLAEHKNDVIPPALRDGANSAAKEAIALQAAELIHDGDTVIFDSSSTVRRICKHIRKRKNLKVITNNLRICQELKDTDIDVYVTGGEFYKKRGCFLGPYAERFLASVNADSVFFSCKGLSPSGALTDVSEDEISMRCAMLRQSRNSYFLCDSSKVGVGCTFTLCNANEVTRILCDKDLPEYKKA
jgi:DeoR/GlpR family transcriptional regulator of sugar metabolism